MKICNLLTQAFFFQVKEQARTPQNIFRPSGQVTEEVFLEQRALEPACILPSQSATVRKFNRARQGSAPKHLNTIDFILEEEHLPDDFLVKDIQQQGCRYIVLASMQQLSVLARTKQWYVDGTFKIVRKPFVQMFSIHCFLRTGDCARQVLLAVAVMSRRTSRDYVAILQAILDSMPAQPAVECVTADYELASEKL